MNEHRAAGLLLSVVAGALLALAGAIAADGDTGEWTIHRAERPDTVRLSLLSTRGGHRFSHSSDHWRKSEFTGLDFSRAGAQDVRFAVTRDAGRFDFEGVLRDGVGAGSYRFSPNTRYLEDMKALGFSDVDGERPMALAIHDVSVAFAREMKTENVRGLNTEKLLAFRIHGVSREFIRALAGAGSKDLHSDQLIAFRIHGVTPEWLTELKQHGYEGIAPDQLIAFRIHDVSSELISSLQKLGYEHPAPEQLVAVRIHDVTPEYIGELQSRGMKDLTLDKLVAMKIHGID